MSGGITGVFYVGEKKNEIIKLISGFLLKTHQFQDDGTEVRIPAALYSCL